MTSDEPVRCARQGYDPHALEKEVEDRWQREDTRASVREQRADAEPFYFVDGPPYTSGHIHLGTAWNKIMKDLLVRYWTMKGYNVRDQPGYDMHGLPIEVKVEKELGISDKKEIEAYGVDNFVDKCREFSMRFLDAMTEEFAELGVWMDWEHPYRTVDDSYMQGAWWAIQQADEADLLYKDNRGGLPWCPRCETALAQAEVEYEDRTDPSIYVKLPLADDEASLVIWTTTPWTIPANNAVAVHPELQYARVLATNPDGSTEELILEDTCVGGVAAAAGYTDTHVLEHMEGSELEGLAYEHPFADEVPYHAERRSENEYTVILGEHVAADRTGLVHTATGHGEEDYQIGLAYGIAPFCPVSQQGLYNELAGELEGLVVKKAADEQGEPPEGHADKVVIDRLAEKGLLIAHGLDEHSYGHCWRCKTPILYLTAEQWFLAVTERKDQMLSEVERVTWTPEWAGAARQRDWVENVRDWCISRQRYWGIPLPVWECGACGATRVIGSKDDLFDAIDPEDETVQALIQTEGFNLHRPWIDEIELPCLECGAATRRTPDVLDVWFDSAVASWASLGYPGDEEAFETWFPCDLIIEGLDQTRGWFYSQLAAGVVAMDRVPYEEVVMHGFVHDEHGRPMSKSEGNIIAPNEVIREFGVDALRFSMLEPSAPWEDLRYGTEDAREAQRALNILWNVHYFATQYMALDGYTAREPTWTEDAPDDPLDAWILSRLSTTTRTVTEHMDAHEYHRAARALRSFILEDLSRWYVRLNRDRAWKAPEDEKTSLYDLLSVVLGTSARLSAPFTPYMAEAIHADLYPGSESVHGQDWPAAEAALVDESLEEDMVTAREIVEAVSRARERADLSLRWPVPRIVLAGDEAIARAVERLEAVLEDQCNAGTVEYAGEDWGELELVAEPDRATIGPTFRGDAPEVMAAIRSADPGKLKELVEAGEPFELDGFELEPGMVGFTTEVPEGILGADFEGGSVFVDAHLRTEHKADGFARELLRRIQEMRKEADLELEATVACTIELPSDAGDWDDVLAIVEDRWADWLSEEGRVELSFGPAGDDARTWEIEDLEVGIALDV